METGEVEFSCVDFEVEGGTYFSEDDWNDCCFEYSGIRHLVLRNWNRLAFGHHSELSIFCRCHIRDLLVFLPLVGEGLHTC